MPLRRARHGGGAAHLKMRALVVQEMHLVGPHVDARFLVPREGVIIIGIPDASHDIDKLLGALIALRMRHMRLAAELQRIVLVAAGDDIPRGAPAGDMVERSHGACEIVGLEIGCRHRGGEADMLRHHGDGRQNRHRVHSVNARRQALRLDVFRAGRAGGVGDEKHVELAALDGLRSLDPALDILSAVIGGAGKPPAGHVIAAVTGEKKRQLHLSRCAFAG